MRFHTFCCQFHGRLGWLFSPLPSCSHYSSLADSCCNRIKPDSTSCLYWPHLYVPERSEKPWGWSHRTERFNSPETILMLILEVSELCWVFLHFQCNAQSFPGSCAKIFASHDYATEQMSHCPDTTNWLSSCFTPGAFCLDVDLCYPLPLPPSHWLWRAAVVGRPAAAWTLPGSWPPRAFV